MRVLLTVPSLDRSFGGPTVKVHRLAAELRAIGHEVVVVGAGASEPGVVGLPVVTHYHGTPIPSRLNHVARLARQADVVHALGYRDPVSTVACGSAGHAGVPYVMEPVGMHRRRLRSVRMKRMFDRAIGEGLLDRAAAIVATSELEAGELLDDGVDPAVVVVRPNGVDVEELMPLPPRGSFRAEHGIPGDAPLVLSLGRIARKKGLVTFVEALSRLPDAWGAVVGPDDGDGALGDLQRALDRLRFRRAVIVPQGLWGAEKADAFADADAFCLPSATENFGNAPAEAAALGLPVVVSRECGVAEFLTPDATGVVDHTDVRAVARGIEQALGTDAREAAVASAADLRGSLAWARVAAQQSEIYEQVVRRDRAPRRRVVLTVPSLRRSFGGPAVQALSFAEAIRQRGYDVRVVGCDAEGRSAIDLGRLGRFHGTPVPRRLAPLARSVRRADLVHVTGFRDPVGTLASLRARVPLVIEPMGMHRRRLRSVRIKTMFDRTVGAWALRRAHVVVATSLLERDELVSDGVDPDRIVVRPNGIDADEPAERGHFRADHDIPSHMPLVVSLGRITAKKGLPELVRAIADLPACWLAIVGPDDGDGTLEEVRRQIERCGVADRVRVETIGKWGSERARVYADADAFCLPSQTENFGNAAAEAAASGVPVVISDRCGAAEFLPVGSTVVVPYGDLDALRAGLDWAMQPEIKARAEATAEAVRSRLSWERISSEQASIYERLLR